MAVLQQVTFVKAPSSMYPHSIPSFSPAILIEWTHIGTNFLGEIAFAQALSLPSILDETHSGAGGAAAPGTFFDLLWSAGWCPSSLAKLVCKSHNYGL